MCQGLLPLCSHPFGVLCMLTSVVLVCVLMLRLWVVLPACRYESAELYWRLFDCGVPVKHLVYNKVSGVDNV